MIVMLLSLQIWKLLIDGRYNAINNNNTFTNTNYNINPSSIIDGPQHTYPKKGNILISVKNPKKKEYLSFTIENGETPEI